MSRTIERMQRRILNREAKEHPPLHSHPKYTIPFSISRFESPKLKIHWKPYSRVCIRIFDGLPPFPVLWNTATLSNSIPLDAGIPVTEDENRFETCLRHRQTLAILATHVEDSRYIAEKAAGNVARRLSRVQDSSTHGGKYVSSLPRCVAYLNHGDTHRDEWCCLFFSSLLREAYQLILSVRDIRTSTMHGWISCGKKNKIWNNGTCDTYFFTYISFGREFRVYGLSILVKLS